jgi:SNF2 family DNA or RNA helicase
MIWDSEVSQQDIAIETRRILPLARADVSCAAISLRLLPETVNVCTLLSYLYTRQHFAHPTLVVAPLSTVNFWLREIERFSNLYGVIYRGEKESRKMLREWEWKWPSPEQMDELNGVRKEEGVDANTDVPVIQRVPVPAAGAKALVRRPYKFNVLITSYEFIMNDHSLLSRVPFSSLIIDEAQRLKSHESKLWEKLNAMGIKRKLLLTGTPIQNRLVPSSKHSWQRLCWCLSLMILVVTVPPIFSMTELWSLLHFIEPTNFPSMHSFLSSFGAMDTVSHVQRLYHELKPYVLRRLKSDVEKGLPPKEEILVELPLTRIQQKYYKAVYERNYKMLTKSSAENNGGARQINSLVNVSMQLRKVSQHPYLLDGAEEEELGLLNASGHTRALTPDQIMEKLVSCSGQWSIARRENGAFASV